MTQFAPGFYDDGAGRRRWHDGDQWGDHYEDTSTPPGKDDPVSPKSSVRSTLTNAASRIVAPVSDHDPSALWQAVGQPLTRIGAGRYKLTAEILYFEKGTISMKAQQIMTQEIFDVDVSQSITQKARSVGTIALNVIRPSGTERIVLEDVADFRNGVTQINAAALAARELLRMKSATQTINYGGGMAPTQYVAPSPGPVPVAAPVTDLNEELGKLAAYRDSGVLSEDEFTAAKRKLLGI